MRLFVECLVICLLFSVEGVSSLRRDPWKLIAGYSDKIHNHAKVPGLLGANKKFLTRYEVILGTENLTDSDHDDWFHIKRSGLGMRSAIVLSLLVDLSIMVPAAAWNSAR